MTEPNAPVDVNNDQVADGVWVDTNNDGAVDGIFFTDPGSGNDVLMADTSGDLQYDVVVIDSNHDGTADQIYKNDNGYWELVTETSPAPASTETETYTTRTSQPVSDSSFNKLDVAQRQAWESQFWQQQPESGFCGPYSIAMVISEALGRPVDGMELTQKAYDLGILHGEPGNWTGMIIADVEKLMESYGVPATVTQAPDESSAWNQLVTDVNSGNHGVIAFVDSDEIWYGPNDSIDQGYGLDHFVVVAAVSDTTVYLNDPGSPDGQWEAVPKEAFMSAWKDSDYAAVETDNEIGFGGEPAVVTAADPQVQVGTQNPVQVPVVSQEPWAPGQPGLNFAQVADAHPWTPDSLVGDFAGKHLVIIPAVVSLAAASVVAARSVADRSTT